MVYLVLAKFTNNETQICFPSIKTLMMVSRLTGPTVSKALKVLEHNDLIAILTVPGKVNHYQLLQPSVPKHLLVSKKKGGVGIKNSLTNYPQSNYSDVSKDTSGVQKDTLNVSSSTQDASSSFNTDKFIRGLRNSPDARDHLVADYWTIKGFHFTSKAEAGIELRRDYGPIKKMDLTVYDSGRVLEVMRWLQDNVSYKWTLETIPKYINEDLSQIEGDKIQVIVIP